jgi:hypothetical protein
VTTLPMRALRGNTGNDTICVRSLFSLVILLSFLSSGCGSALPGANLSQTTTADKTLLKANPSPVSFGTTQIGKPQIAAVTLTNRNTALVTVQSVRVLSSAAFKVLGSTNRVPLAPGESTRFVVAFTPPAKGIYQGQLAIVSEVAPRDPLPRSRERGYVTTASVSLWGAATAIAPAPTAQISIVPGSVRVKAGQSQQFTASVVGLTSSEVIWNASLGRVTASGMYTAPNVQTTTVDTVWATSAVSASTSAATQVSVTPIPAPAPLPPSPAPVPPSQPGPNPSPTPVPSPPVDGLYISPSGSDSNPGTEAQPWKTFGRAIAGLNPGSTLVLEDGVYTAAKTGLLNVNCSAGASSGTAAAPITVMAQHERQATIEGGGYSGVQITNCSYWNIQGVYVTNADVPLYPCNYHNVNISNSDHISVIRTVVDHTNGYCNAHGIAFAYGNGYNLAQENEVYDFHRHGIVFGFNANNAAIRNYVNPRGRTDMSGCQATACQGNGHFGYAAYPAALTLFENNISEGMQTIIPGDSGVGYDNEADYAPSLNHDNAWYGNISLNDEYAWRAAARCDNGEACSSALQPINDLVSNFVAYQSSANTAGTTYGIYPRSTFNTQFDHLTQLGFAQAQGGTGTIGLIADFQCVNSSGSYGPAGGGVYSVFVSDSIFENNGQGINAPLASTTCAGVTTSYSFGFDRDAFFNNGAAVVGAGVTNQVNLSSNQLGSCILWVPSSASSLKGRAKDGGDIGATVLYQYSNGKMTNIPLWNSDGQFAAAGAATPDGINRISGESLFDVGTRLNVNQNGCSFPAGYVPGS